MTQPNPDETPFLLANWGHRLIAFLVEMVIFIVIFIVFYSVVMPIVEDLVRDDKNYATFADAINSFLSLLFTALLYAAVIVLAIWGGLLEGIWGCTPGKVVAGLKVVSAEDHNKTIGFTRGIAREIIRSSPIILLCLSAITGIESPDQSYSVFFLVLFLLSVPMFVLDHLWPLWDKERQALHDKIANSHVVSKESTIVEQVPYDNRRRTGYFGDFPPSGGLAPPLSVHRHDPR